MIEKLFTVGRRLRAHLTERLDAIGANGDAYTVLYTLAASPRRLTQSELASRLGLAGSSMVRIIDRLEQQGRVSRELMAGDRRSKLLRLEPAGANALKEFVAMAEGLCGELCDGETDELLRSMSELLDRLLIKLATAAAARTVN